jgi:hypothetical protein
MVQSHNMSDFLLICVAAGGSHFFNGKYTFSSASRLHACPRKEDYAGVHAGKKQCVQSSHESKSSAEFSGGWRSCLNEDYECKI